MTQREANERYDFQRALGEECAQLNNGAIPQWARRQKGEHAGRLLCRHGVTYSRIQESYCNGPGDYATAAQIERWKAAVEKREAQLEARIRAIVADLGEGFGVVFNGDPRGSTIKVTVPSGRTNDWGHEGICVPTA